MDLPEPLRSTVAAWVDDDPDPVTRAEVADLVERADLDGLRDRFEGALAFGTAGLRGPLGAGPNRMNLVVVRRAAAAFGRWLDEHGIAGPVIVGRDARHRSDDFAIDTARILAATGREVVLLADAAPTPLVAYALRALGGAGAIVVTASHNPPADNGYKVYGPHGAQIIAPADAQIAAHMDAIATTSTLEVADVDDPRIAGLEPGVVGSYLAEVTAMVRGDGARVRVAYTPMHGVGRELVAQAFTTAGFPEPHVVAEQADPDPDFPTVAFPNPEEPGAMDLLLATASLVGADVALANDPDADRLAVAVPDRDGGWRPLTGDEIGILLADHVLGLGSGHDRLVATTIVSSTLLGRLAAARRVGFVETLTGFKWLADAARRHPESAFVFGYEEALGYSVGGVVADKDGVSAALVFTDLVGALAARGVTVLDRLDALAVEFGVHATRQRSMRFPGLTGATAMAERVQALRSDPPRTLGGHPVTEVEDLAVGRRLPPTDAVIVRTPSCRVVVRPSGTEPKLKCYLEVVEPVTDTADLDAARHRAEAVLDRVTADLEARLA